MPNILFFIEISQVGNCKRTVCGRKNIVAQLFLSVKIGKVCCHLKMWSYNEPPRMSELLVAGLGLQPAPLCPCSSALAEHLTAYICEVLSSEHKFI